MRSWILCRTFRSGGHCPCRSFGVVKDVLSGRRPFAVANAQVRLPFWRDSWRAERVRSILAIDRLARVRSNERAVRMAIAKVNIVEAGADVLRARSGDV